MSIDIRPVPFVLITIEITTNSICRSQHLIEIISSVTGICSVIFLQSSHCLESCHNVQCMTAVEQLVVARI